MARILALAFSTISRDPLKVLHKRGNDPQNEPLGFVHLFHVGKVAQSSEDYA